jgi:HD-like signal output (HDOD) protein
MGTEEHKRSLLSIRDLPTLPSVLDEITRLVDDPDSSTEQIAHVITRDQALSAKVLKMVNSPIYGFPGRISSVHHALVLLGLNVIRGIIISTTVFEMMIQSMTGLWAHSLGCAMTCTTLAKTAGLKDPEEYAVAGLLHDIGKVVVAVQLPEQVERIEQTVAERDIPYLSAEKEVLGFGHDRINGWLADHWNLPLNLKEGITFHHAPAKAAHYPRMAAVAHLSNFFVHFFEYGESGYDAVPRLESKALELLGFTLADVEKILDKLVVEFDALEDVSFS